MFTLAAHGQARLSSAVGGNPAQSQELDIEKPLRSWEDPCLELLCAVLEQVIMKLLPNKSEVVCHPRRNTSDRGLGAVLSGFQS